MTATTGLTLNAVFCLASVEEAILNALAEPAARDRWAAWYAGAFALLDQRPAGP